ncbi:MAG: hypothetical protein AAB879_03250 [Patescibacteria group bacterium]
MQSIYISILFGVLGGSVRALIGLLKYYEKNIKHKKIRFGYLTFSLLVAAAVGAFAGALEQGDWRLAILSGYVWTDFLEGIYKIKQEEGLEI